MYVEEGNESPPPPPPVEKIVTMESLQYEWETLKAATRNFSDDRKLGQGGFGIVYKVLQQFSLSECVGMVYPTSIK